MLSEKEVLTKWQLNGYEANALKNALKDVQKMTKFIYSSFIFLDFNIFNVEVNLDKDTNIIKINLGRVYQYVEFPLRKLNDVITYLEEYNSVELKYKKGNFVRYKHNSSKIFYVLTIYPEDGTTQVVDKNGKYAIENSYLYEKWYPRVGDDVVVTTKTTHKIVSFDSSKYKRHKVFPYGFMKSQYDSCRKK